MGKRRGLMAVLAVIILSVVVHDAVVPVSQSVSTHAVLLAIGQYQMHVSPHLRGRVFCRFTPTCSVYGMESVRKYGAVRGGLRALWRVMRCGPWTKAGPFDPP